MQEAAEILNKHLENAPGSPIPGGKTYFAIVDAMLEFRNDLEDEHVWTDDDVDAAYLMGALNTAENPLEDIVLEIRRLERLGLKRPHQAVKQVRQIETQINE